MNGAVLLRENRDSAGENWTPRADNAEDLDLRLVERCAQDDPLALRELTRRYQAKLTRYLVQILGAHEDAEEAVLDVFLRVWREAGRFERRSSFTTWLYRIATNVAYDRLRRQKARRRTNPGFEWADTVAPDAEALALGNLEAGDQARLLRRCLERLRPDERLLLTLYYGEEMNYDEIGRVVHCPAPVLRVRLMRARRRLRAVMESEAPEDMG